MTCCCAEALNDGRPPSGGTPGGDTSAFAIDYDSGSGVVVSTPLVDLVAVGSWAMFRGVDMSSVVLAAGGFAAADFGVTWSLGTCTAQRNATESFVYGAPSGGLFVPSQNAGYLVPATVAPAGYGAFTLAIVGTQVHVQTSAPVLPGVMVSFAIRGNLYVFGGATRLIP